MSEIEKTDQEWREILSDLTYKVTRKHGTERAFSHDDFPKQAGSYACVCCEALLFSQTDKFDSAGPAGHLLHGRQRAQTWAKALIKVGFQPEQKCIAKPVLRIWGMCFPMALLRPVCATA